MLHATHPVTVRTRWLTIGEGGMSSPPPSTAHVLVPEIRTVPLERYHRERETGSGVRQL